MSNGECDKESMEEEMRVYQEVEETDSQEPMYLKT